MDHNISLPCLARTFSSDVHGSAQRRGTLPGLVAGSILAGVILVSWRTLELPQTQDLSEKVVSCSHFDLHCGVVLAFVSYSC